ncbi:MAG: lactate racemase domain-containing protein [Gaiellaceae bacterium]
MRRVPLLAGSRIVSVPVDADDVVVRPPAPPGRVVDVSAAVRDALRFPLSGPPLESIAPRGGRATVVVEPPALPVPGVQRDPRREALAATLQELERCHVRSERLTILVAGGLGRRLGQRELESLLPPPQARAFRGRVVVHDAEGADLLPIEGGARINSCLLETELVVAVTAAETVVNGGTGVLIGSCDAATIRRTVGATSLLVASTSPAWREAFEIERVIAARATVVGVSLVLDLPRLSGAFRGYPDDLEAVRNLERSWTRTVFSRLPGALRVELLERQGRRLDVTAAYAGPPSVAHAEALVRGVELRGAHLEQPVDGLVVGVPWVGPHLPRARVNPITASAVALGLAVRLHRNAFPIRDDGTLVLVHPLTRSFAPQDAPYIPTLEALRKRDPGELEAAEQLAASDEAMIAAYRRGDTCHPLLPYADWAACAPALARLGRVIVAGCRDAHAARSLGFVPSRGIGSALEMAHGVAGGRARMGILLAPPYPPLIVG